jgi:bacillithiol biosynthesis cysteine-adding enzyme BshC
MQCTCVRQTDIPNTSKLFTDLIYHFDRVADLYSAPPNNLESIAQAARFDFPAERRAALVEALRPLNAGNPSLDKLAQPDTVAIITGQQVGLFSGPSYTVYKALTAIRIAGELNETGVPAVPVFWLATEDHDFAEVDHVWAFTPDHKPVRLHMDTNGRYQGRPAGQAELTDLPIDALRTTLDGFPFADEALDIVKRAWQPGQTMGSAFARFMRECFAQWGLLLVDPMEPALRRLASPFIREAVARMPELTEALMARGEDLKHRGYHAQVLVEKNTSLVFLLEDGERKGLKQNGTGFATGSRKISTADLAGLAEHLSPNALLRPVAQDYMLPTAAYIGGPAELAYLAQSRVLYEKLLGRQPVAFPRAGFTLVDARSAKRMARYGFGPADLFTPETTLRESIGARLVPPSLSQQLERTKAQAESALSELKSELETFDPSLANTLETSRRKIEYQFAKMGRKTGAHILARDEQADRDAHALSGLVYPERHLQERLYSIIPFLAKFGPGLIGELYDQVHVECPDHQFVTL